MTPFEEHHFWLKILDDHAHFVRDYLSPTEKEYVKTAQSYIEQFANLRKALEQLSPQVSVSTPEMIEFSRQVHTVAYGYFSFESQLQYLRLRNQVNLNLTPSFLTGTLLENQEYLRILGYYTCGKDAPPLALIPLLDLWLEDQAGHAELLSNGLDPLETATIEQARGLAKVFINYWVHNQQMKQMQDFTHADIPQQQTFVLNVIRTVDTFLQLVLRILKQYREDQLFSRMTYRFLEHHLPETCYFLQKLSFYAPKDAPIPNCQLTPPYFYA